MEKYKRLSVQSKSAIWFTLCSILQKGIAFITVPIFTRLLTEEEYGTYSLYLSWFQILTIVTSLYLYQGVFNNGMTKFDKDRDTYISSMQGLTITITAAFFLIFLATHGFWEQFFKLDFVLIVIMFLEMLFAPAMHFWSGRQRFETRYKRLVAITLVKSVLNPALGLVMVLLSKDRAFSRILSVVIIEVLFSGILMLYQFYKGKKFFRLDYWKYALGIAIPLLPHYLSGMILNHGDRIMIGRLVGKPEVAFYSVAYNIGMMVQIVTHAISNSFTPWFYQKFKANDYSGIKSTINFLLIAIALTAIGLMMCSPELVLIFGSAKYASAVYVIPPVAASVFFIFLYNLLAIPQFYFEKTRYMALASVLAALMNIILNYIFIRIYGFIAAGYTTLVCYVLYSIGHYVVSQRVLKKYAGGVIPFDRKFILLLSVIVIIVGIGCNYVFEYWYIRYLLITIFLLVGFINRKKLLSFVGF